MEARLLPVNAILGLLTLGDVNPAALAQCGFTLGGLEVPVVGPAGRVDVDMLLFHQATSHFVLLEAKSGANIDPSQAGRYAKLDAPAIVQASGVSVPKRGELTFEVAYVCLAEHAERIRQGRRVAGVAGALITVGARSITFERDNAPTPLDEAWARGPIELSGPVVRLLPFDADSPPTAFEPAIQAQMVAELSHRRREVTVRLLTELVVPYFPIFAAPMQRQLVNKVRDAVRSIIEADPGTFRYLPTTGTRQEDIVELLVDPEALDTRGRTQAYQALYGRRSRQDGDQRQLDLLDLLAERASDDVGGQQDNDDEGGEPTTLGDDDSMDTEEEV